MVTVQPLSTCPLSTGVIPNVTASFRSGIVTTSGITTLPDGVAVSRTSMALSNCFDVSVLVNVARTAFPPAPSLTISGCRVRVTPGTSSSKAVNVHCADVCPTALAINVYSISPWAVSSSASVTANSPIFAPAGIVTVAGYVTRLPLSPDKFTVSASVPASCRTTTTVSVSPSRKLLLPDTKVSAGTSSSSTVSSAAAPSYPSADTASVAVLVPSTTPLFTSSAMNDPDFAPAGIVIVPGTLTFPGRLLITSTSKACPVGPRLLTTHRTPPASSLTSTVASSKVNVLGISAQCAYSVLSASSVTLFVVTTSCPPSAAVNHPTNSQPSRSTIGISPYAAPIVFVVFCVSGIPPFPRNVVTCSVVFRYTTSHPDGNPAFDNLSVPSQDPGTDNVWRPLQP